MSTPLVSIVLPCYNYAQYLSDSLNSLFHQDGDYEIEVIAVDDASPDNSAEILASCRDPRLRIITHSKNQGHIAAVTHGFEAARGKYLARLDPDDRYRPNFLSTLVPILESYPEVGMAYGDAALMNDQGEVVHPGCDTVHGGRDFKGNELVAIMEKHFICAPTALARREAWLKALPVPSHLAFNDIWFNFMMAREWEFYYKDVVVADYRVHQTNWNRQIVVNGKHEPSVFWLLDLIYSTPEKTPDLQQAKLKARNRVYGAQWLIFAQKYFGAGMEAEARRCYLKAIRTYPWQFLDFEVFRNCVGAFLGAERYMALKAAIGKAPNRS